GKSAIIRAISAPPALGQRLMEMGLLEGDRVEMLAVAPLGDPLELRVGDYRLSLRRSEAASVEVELAP
ncbi:MAG: ferrous iron transport protein A, partial [Gemmataceae bacterium]|nr:ferrous iron transport protein A [Gemmataceae bacterium]